MKYKEIIDRWNKDADEYNSWDNLGEEEKIEFAFQLGFVRKNDFIPFDPTKEKPTEIPKLTHLLGFSGIPEDEMKREVLIGLYNNDIYKLMINTHPKGKESFTTAIGLTKFGCEIVMATLKEALYNIEKYKL